MSETTHHTPETTIHAFEEAGLGRAPFKLVGVEERRYQSCPGAPTQPGDTCDFCGTGIVMTCIIRSADGREFVVGNECVKKTGDKGLIDPLKRRLRRLQAEARLAKYKASPEYRRKEAERVARVFQREQEEIRYLARMVGEAERAVVENAWLISVLEVARESDFVTAMRNDLSRRSFRELPTRAQEILSDIYAKTVTGGARRNSKPYTEALDEFDRQAGIAE